MQTFGTFTICDDMHSNDAAFVNSTRTADGGELAVREVDFADWIANAEPGTRLTYHTGHLGVDRVPGFSRLPAAQRDELSRVANRAMDLAQQGIVLLAQERGDDGIMSYMVIKASQQFKEWNDR